MKGMNTAVLALLWSAETGLQLTGFLLSCLSSFGRGVACVKFSLETVPFADGFGPICLLKWTALNTSLLSGVWSHIRWRFVWIAFLYTWWHKDASSVLGHQYLEKRRWFLCSQHVHKSDPHKSAYECEIPPPPPPPPPILAQKAKAIDDHGALVTELSTHQTTSWNIKIPLKANHLSRANHFKTLIYQQSFNQISRVLSEHNINMVNIPPRKMFSLPCSTINDLGLKSSSI